MKKTSIYRTKQLANIAINTTQSIWSRNQMKQKKRIKLYRALVKSTLQYKCSTWGVPSIVEQSLDAFHRRQLRRVLGFKFPIRISNKQLYEITGEKPRSSTMRKARWELFCHILRRDRNITAYKAMELYFRPVAAKGFREKPRTNLPQVRKNDLNTYYTAHMFTREDSYCHRLKLNNIQDLEEIRNLAQNREGLRHLSVEIMRAGEAASSIDEAAKLK